MMSLKEMTCLRGISKIFHLWIAEQNSISLSISINLSIYLNIKISRIFTLIIFFLIINKKIGTLLLNLKSQPSVLQPKK